MIIDSHVHVVNFSDLPAQEGYNACLQEIFSQMKQSGVDHIIIIPDRKKDLQVSIDMESAVEIGRAYKNVHVLGAMDVFKYSSRGFRQLEQYMSRGEIHGLKLYPGYQHFYPSDSRCEPFYKLCLKYDLPVVFHSGDTTSMNFPVKVKFAHPLAVDEVAADFPDLKIVIAHLGNPWLMDCAEVLYKNSNVYADISGLFWDEQPPSSAYGKLIWSRVADLITYAGSEKLLYGTDWPVMDMKPYLKLARGLPVKDTERLFYKNVVQLFKLKI